MAEAPVLIREEEMWSLWYKPDVSFGTPKAVIYMALLLPEVGPSTTAETPQSLF